MRNNGLVVWILGGVGVLMIYAAWKNATIAEVLGGHIPSGASAAVSTVIDGTPKQMASAKNPSGNLANANFAHLYANGRLVGK